jgi:predicted branched-subunit amino acid permease
MRFAVVLKDASGAPAMVLFAGMVGFGAMGKTSGFDLSFTALSSLLMFALPGQVVLMEMMLDGASLLAIALGRDIDLNALYYDDHHLVSAAGSA